MTWLPVSSHVTPNQAHSDPGSANVNGPDTGQRPVHQFAFWRQPRPSVPSKIVVPGMVCFMAAVLRDGETAY